MVNKKKQGRPINSQSSGALKAAAMILVREKGYDKVSIATIVQKAGVARQTLYNRWDTKADLILEAVFEETHAYAAAPVLDGTKSCCELLENFLVNVFDHLKVDGDTLRALIAVAQQDRTFHEGFYSNFVFPRELMIRDLLYLAQEVGELSSSRDVELISASIHGVFWYRLLNRGALDHKLAHDIAFEVFNRSD